ncbi:histone lysine [Cyclospora cayetanensis]|uniref:Histone lysine n=1 Tax=Cyclospora cayetanensis TaxID=88456 RepID=A0A1D3D571_9EIME|nr:histone lysine [Cyclospora cayetanensis]
MPATGSDREASLPRIPKTADGSFLPRGALIIAESRIPGAGLGLFVQQPTYTDVEPGTWICEYLGERKSLMQVMRMEDREYVYARYVNDNGDRRALNAEFFKFKHEGRVLLRATAEVKAGSEIYASYGEVFWRNRKMVIGYTPAAEWSTDSG